jgi:outer membrane receptor protein involved in Fe transport
MRTNSRLTAASRTSRNSTLARAVAAILGASAAHAVLAVGAANPIPDPGSTGSGSASNASQLQEVIVTAERRVQNAQDVPITIQALTGQTLQALHVETLSDYLKYVPNVTMAETGPGEDTLFIRGISTGLSGVQALAATGQFPNVALYLDDQPTDMPGRQLDVYAVDLERIEVLEGPQGTLFGAGAQAGVVRYVTNKPALNKLEVSANAGYGTTAHGDPNSSVNAMLNLPLLKDTLAARVVIFTDHRGGYINNLPATFARSGTDLGLKDENGGVVPANSPTIDNYDLVANAINPVSYQGGRASLLWKINDDWSALVEQTYQSMDAQGVFYEMPYGSAGTVLSASGVPSGGQPLPPYSVNMFEPSYNKDTFEDTALTVKGKVGPIGVVYAGSYLDRNTQSQGDYTNYARGRYGYYYQCTGVSYSATKAGAGATCYSPGMFWHETLRNTHLSQELRASTPDDWRLRGVVGLYYENEKIYDVTDWLYRTVPQCSPSGPASNCFLPVGPRPAESTNEPGLRNSLTAFSDDYIRTFIQKAAYVSSSFDLIPKVLTITGGIRYFDMYDAVTGGDFGSFGCKAFGPTSSFGRCLSSNGVSFDAQDPHTQVLTGHLGRANLSWHVTPDVMLYYTYSQGYRPGGFNRGATGHLPGPDTLNQFYTPEEYGSDLLTNNEAGWKSEWFDHHLLFNGALYQEHWDNAQTVFFCSACGFGNVSFQTNGPFYQVRGLELQLAAHVFTGLSVQGSASWNSSRLTNSPALVDNNPDSVNFGKPITSRYLNGVATPVANVYGPEGSSLAFSPPFEANLRVRYDWSVGSYLPYVQVGFQHQAHTHSATGYLTVYDQPDWTTYDASVGVSKDDWTLSIDGSNLTNVNKSLFSNAWQFIETQTPMRPRVLELNFHYQFQQAE